MITLFLLFVAGAILFGYLLDHYDHGALFIPILMCIICAFITFIGIFVAPILDVRYPTKYHLEKTSDVIYVYTENDGKFSYDKKVDFDKLETNGPITVLKQYSTAGIEVTKKLEF